MNKFDKLIADKKRKTIPPIDPEEPKPIGGSESMTIPETPLVKEADILSPFTTQLFKYQKKAIKMLAVEQERNEQEVVREALDEYFHNHQIGNR